MTVAEEAFSYKKLAELAALELQLIRAQKECVNSWCSTDFGWIMLLDLYLAERNSLPTQTTYLIEQSGASRATGLRILKRLEEEELIRRFQRNSDAKSKFIELSAKGRQSLDTYLVTAFTALRDL